MSKLTQEEKRIRLAKACGVQPQRMWRVFYDNARQTGAVRIRTRNAAVIRAENERQSAERLNYPCEVSEPEEYDDYDHAPDYFGSLDVVHEAEKALTDLQWNEWEFTVVRMFMPRGATPLTQQIAKMSATQRAEALGQALGLWKEGE